MGRLGKGVSGESCREHKRKNTLVIENWVMEEGTTASSCLNARPEMIFER